MYISMFTVKKKLNARSLRLEFQDMLISKRIIFTAAPSNAFGRTELETQWFKSFWIINLQKIAQRKSSVREVGGMFRLGLDCQYETTRWYPSSAQENTLTLEGGTQSAMTKSSVSSGIKHRIVQKQVSFWIWWVIRETFSSNRAKDSKFQKKLSN